MKYLLLLVSIPSFLIAQVNVVSPTNLSVNLNNTTIEVAGAPANFELEEGLWLIRQDTVSRQVKCRKIEVDVLAGTQNTTCWVFCPTTYDFAGDYPSYVAPLTESFNNSTDGDTIRSFSAHYRPKGLDGCSLFKYEWFDSADPSVVLCAVFVRFTHNVNTSCTASLTENKEVEFSMFPNPATTHVSFKVDQSNVSIQIVDLLGKIVIEKTPIVSNKTIAIDELKNGVYFVSVIKNGDILKTQKLIVKQ